MGVLECQHLEQEEVAMEPGGTSDGQRIKPSLRGVRHGWGEERQGWGARMGREPDVDRVLGWVLRL